MIEYHSADLAGLLLVPSATIYLDRIPLDPSYATMIQSKMQTGIFDSCFESLIRNLWNQGKFFIKIVIKFTLIT